MVSTCSIFLSLAGCVSKDQTKQTDVLVIGETALATGWVSNTQFEPHIGDIIFKLMAAAVPQLTVIYGYHLTGVLKHGDKVTGALFENEQKERLTVQSKVVIDASDLGDGLEMAGAAYDLDMESRSVTGEENAPET